MSNSEPWRALARVRARAGARARALERARARATADILVVGSTKAYINQV